MFDITLETVGIAGIFFFTVWELWGEYLQGKKIWKKESGESVSFTAYGIHNAVFAATLIYGLTLGSIAYIVNGAFVLPVLIWILVGLFTYKKHSKKERIQVCLLLLAIALMGTFAVLRQYAWVEIMAFLFLVSVVWAELQMLWELYRGRGTGAFEIRTNLVWLASNSFFFLYSYAIRDWVFFTTTGSLVVIQTVITLIYLKKRKEVIPLAPITTTIPDDTPSP